MNGEVVIDPVEGKRGRALFVDTGRRFASREPHAVPQLRGEQLELDAGVGAVGELHQPG